MLTLIGLYPTHTAAQEVTMPAIRTLVRESRMREPEEERVILTVSALRAFWTKHISMKISLEGFHKAMMYIEAELRKRGEEAGFTYDPESRRSPEVDKILSELAEKKFFKIEWSGEEDEIVFDADTGKRLLAKLQDMNLEAEENRTLLPLCTAATNFYVGCRTRKTGCDQ